MQPALSAELLSMTKTGMCRRRRRTPLATHNVRRPAARSTPLLARPGARRLPTRPPALKGSMPGRETTVHWSIKASRDWLTPLTQITVEKDYRRNALFDQATLERRRSPLTTAWKASRRVCLSYSLPADSIFADKHSLTTCNPPALSSIPVAACCDKFLRHPLKPFRSAYWFDKSIVTAVEKSLNSLTCRVSTVVSLCMQNS